MARARFDILFSGQLLENADQGLVRLWLQQRFKLSGTAATRLFDGDAHTIERDVDTATASHFREVFREVGALIEIRPAAAQTDTLMPDITELSVAAQSISALEDASPQHWTRPALDDIEPAKSARKNEPSTQMPAADRPIIDTSHLSLVPGLDWTLEDCQPSPSPVQLPDTSNLELVAPEPDEVEGPPE